nr:Chain B, Histone-lysine N-methyltransferase MLL3 [Homo sapiens]
GSARAEPKMSA